MAEERKVIKVDELLEVIRKACSDAQENIKVSELPPLKSVSLNLATTLEHGETVGAELLIVSAEAKLTVKSTQEITVKFERPEPSGPPARGFAGEKDMDVYRGVVNAIRAAAASAKAAYNVKIGQTVLGPVTASVAFDVTKREEGGLQFFIKLLKLGPELSCEQTGSHKIELEFAKS